MVRRRFLPRAVTPGASPARRARRVVGWVLLLATQGCLDGSIAEGLASTCEPACAEGTHCEETTCVPDPCGDLELQDPEECDAGPDPAADDPCGADCKFRCGNGRVQAGEECDDGTQHGTTHGECNSRCQWVRCGNGTVDPGEACDDGEANGAAGDCSADCAVQCPDAVFEEPVVALAAGDSHLILLGADGRLWGLGAGGNGELGQGDDLEAHRAPVSIPSPSAHRIRSIATGWRTSFVIDEVGALYGTGMNEGDSLGLGPGRSGAVHTLALIGDGVTGEGPWRSISSGSFHTLGIKEDRTLWSWGNNAKGQLGTGTGANSALPVQVGDGLYTAVAAGHSHSLALRDDGILVVFGSNERKALGREGPDLALPEPLALPDGKVARSIAAGFGWSFAVTGDGEVYQWGGRFEVEGNPSSATPERVELPGAPRVVRVTSLLYTAVAIDEAGRAYSWGFNNAGQTAQASDDPNLVPGLLEQTGVLDVGTGTNYSALLVSAGTPELPAARVLTAGFGSLAVRGRGEAGEAITTLGPVCR